MLLLALPSLLAVLHPVGLPHRLGASSKARVLTMCATDQADPSRWALFKDAEGVPQLRAASGEFLESMEKIRVERSPERPGLGIGLVEHGAADDGSAALVLVSEVAPGSNADVAASAPLMPGDALLYVGYPGAAAKGEATRVEGRSYDDTVEAIASLPDGPIELVIKRLTVRPKATVTLQFPEAEGRADESIVLYAGANLRRSILTRGITLNDPLARRFDAGVGTGDCGGEGALHGSLIARSASGSTSLHHLCCSPPHISPLSLLSGCRMTHARCRMLLHLRRRRSLRHRGPVLAKVTRDADALSVPTVEACLPCSHCRHRTGRGHQNQGAATWVRWLL